MTPGGNIRVQGALGTRETSEQGYPRTRQVREVPLGGQDRTQGDGP